MKKQTKSNFFERVYDVVRCIPKAKVATYGQIAKILGVPKWSQVVGFALHVNPLSKFANAPEDKIVPCHRVVNRFGGVCEAFAFGGAHVQRTLLQEEGVVFEKDGSVDLKKFQWQPSLLDDQQSCFV